MFLYRRLPGRVKASRPARRGAALRREWADAIARGRLAKAARAYTSRWVDPPDRAPTVGRPAPSAPEAFFESHTEGRGIFKWRHYFEIYDRHLSRFVDEPSALLEIGIAGGGSMDLWRAYLGPGCARYGVDIDPECEKLADVTVFIGDQADRTFWARVRAETPPFDVIIDDGGHDPVQQLVTLEELLPCLRPGGVYICEDIHGDRNPFLGYVYGLSRGLFGYEVTFDAEPERAMASPATSFQSAVHSIHLYPFVVVIERRREPELEFVASKHGTEWPLQWQR
jgi:hypothetical protein